MGFRNAQPIFIGTTMTLLLYHQAIYGNKLNWLAH